MLFFLLPCFFSVFSLVFEFDSCFSELFSLRFFSILALFLSPCLLSSITVVSSSIFFIFNRFSLMGFEFFLFMNLFLRFCDLGYGYLVLHDSLLYISISKCPSITVCTIDIIFAVLSCIHLLFFPYKGLRGCFSKYSQVWW